jgi:hypothetical protein
MTFALPVALAAVPSEYIAAGCTERLTIRCAGAALAGLQAMDGILRTSNATP